MLCIVQPVWQYYSYNLMGCYVTNHLQCILPMQDYARLPLQREAALGATYTELDDLVGRCDVITINCPLHEGT